MRTGHEKILIIIPAYNEEATIADVIAEIKQCLPPASIVVVNDGSTDGTAGKAGEAGAIVLQLPFNCGIGVAMQTGYKYAHREGYDIAVQVDADLQHKPSEIPKLLNVLRESKAEIVIGSRYKIQGRAYGSTPLRKMGTRIFSVVVSFIIRKEITDATSGFRAMKKSVLRYYAREYPFDYPEVESLVLLNRMGFVIQEVPVEMSERKGGESSITFLRSAYYMIKVMLAILIDVIKRRK